MLVLDARRRLGFAPEALASPGIAGQVWLHDLQGHRPPQVPVLRLEDNPHAPTAQLLPQTVRAQPAQFLRTGRGCQECQVRHLKGALGRTFPDGPDQPEPLHQIGHQLSFGVLRHGGLAAQGLKQGVASLEGTGPFAARITFEQVLLERFGFTLGELGEQKLS